MIPFPVDTNPAEGRDHTAACLSFSEDPPHRFPHSGCTKDTTSTGTGTPNALTGPPSPARLLMAILPGAGHCLSVALALTALMISKGHRLCTCRHVDITIRKESVPVLACMCNRVTG